MVSPQTNVAGPRPQAPVNPQWRLRARTSGRFWTALAVLGALLSVASPTFAAFDFKDPSWEGSSELLSLARERLGSQRVRVVAKLDYSALTPGDGVLVLHPEVELKYDEVSGFLAAGGRLAVLDDFGAADRLLEHYHIFRVQAPLRPAASLRDNPALALAVPAVQAVAGQEQNRHPIVANVDRIVTNHPSALTNPNLTPVLTIPALGEPDATLAVTGVIAGHGRLFALSDPSVVINLMLRYPGNRSFAQGLVDYLVEDDTWGTRGGALYVLANRFDQGGHFGKGDGLTGGLAQAAASATEALADWHREGLPPPFALVLAALSALGTLTWMGLYALRRYRPAPPRHAAIVPLLAQGGLPGRAAVLSAPSTDRALVVAELDALLREELAQRAGLPPTATPEAALAALEEQGTSSSLLERARALLRAARRAQDAIVRRKPSRLDSGQVAAHERRLDELLLDLDRPGT
ncbi:MAG TPA: DUF4350 domain-containing protein [Polyangiaceae bacterium]|nr:DUF4350 domain-containing protein [Polyangiaceae bacterium]